MPDSKQTHGMKYWTAVACAAGGLGLAFMPGAGDGWIQSALILGLVLTAGTLLWLNQSGASREQRLYTVAQTMLCCGLILLPLGEVPDGLDTLLAVACTGYLVIMVYIGWCKWLPR